MSIAQQHEECYIAFENLCKASERSEKYRSTVVEEFDKYSLWAGNVGAAHSGKAYMLSLDYRLREASFYRDQVQHMLFFTFD
jgi:hypothetical protein